MHYILISISEELGQVPERPHYVCWAEVKIIPSSLKVYQLGI